MTEIQKEDNDKFCSTWELDLIVWYEVTKWEYRLTYNDVIIVP